MRRVEAANPSLTVGALFLISEPSAMKKPMTRPVAYSIVLTLLSLGIALFGLACAEPATERRPNVIIILTDDQGFGDAGVHGNDKIRTPNLDRFAREGVEFTRFYVSPVCAPTRASLMTGRYYYRSGVIHTSRGGAKMHGDEVTLAETLRGAGYRTGIFGKWHLGDNYPMRPMDQGFGESLVHKSGGIDQTPDKPNGYFDPLLWRNGQAFHSKGYCTDVFFNAALGFIEDNQDEPFFIYLPTNAPHGPLIVDEKYSSRYAEMGLDDPTAKVYGMIENIDENFGRLIAKLDELNLRDDTIVMFISDNGPAGERYNAGLRGRKAQAYEGGIRALSFLQWPRRVKTPAKIDRIAAHIDVAPTVLDAAGVTPPENIAFDGVNLMPLIDGSAQNWPERTLFFQCHRGLSPQPYQNAAAVTDRYKLVMSANSFNDENLQLPPEPPLELYDIEADPGEQQDLSSQHADVLADLRGRYDAWFEDVRGTREFTPGVIHLGSDEEQPAVLCRYQDQTYEDGEPTGWAVEIERGGEYELTVNRGGESGPVTMYVRVDDGVTSAELAAGTASAVFELAAGKVVLDVWVQEPGQPRVVISNNGTLGDVTVRRLE